MRYIIKIITLLFLLNLSLYANTVGTITALSGSASILRDGKSIEATLGAKLEQKDSIKTSDATKIQIIFIDETIISIGKNSNFSIDEFLFEESEAPSAKFGLLSGAMRTITGKIADVAPDKFSVKTKTATIGIRGTNFSIFTGEDGSAKIFCTFGAISVTAQGSSSVVTQGFYILVSADGTRSAPIKFTPQELKEAQEESFASSSEGDSSDPDSQDSDASEPMADSPIDTNNNEDLGLVVENITDSARQAAEQEVLNRVNDSLSGYAISPESLDHMLVVVSVEDSTFDGASIVDGQKIYTTSTTANSFTSMDNFTSTIVSIIDPTKTNIVLGASEENYFNATGDDLSAGDSMSWGEWGVSYDADDSYGDTYSYNPKGLWIAGEATPTSVIDGYRNANTSMTYSGEYKAILSNTIEKIKGDATLNVDFGADSANLIIHRDAVGYISTDPTTEISGSISGNQMSGATGDHKFSGGFYGADGKSAGGTFYLDNAGVLANGVYQVKAP